MLKTNCLIITICLMLFMVSAKAAVKTESEVEVSKSVTLVQKSKYNFELIVQAKIGVEYADLKLFWSEDHNFTSRVFVSSERKSGSKTITIAEKSSCKPTLEDKKTIICKLNPVDVITFETTTTSLTTNDFDPNEMDSIVSELEKTTLIIQTLESGVLKTYSFYLNDMLETDDSLSLDETIDENEDLNNDYNSYDSIVDTSESMCSLSPNSSFSGIWLILLSLSSLLIRRK